VFFETTRDAIARTMTDIIAGDEGCPSNCTEGIPGASKPVTTAMTTES
jgi:hypothetical protein